MRRLCLLILEVLFVPFVFCLALADLMAEKMFGELLKVKRR